MAIVAYALTSKDNVKEYLDVSGSGDDTLIENLINRATDFIESECKRRFKDSTYTDELYDGDGKSKELILKQFPITSTQAFSIKIDDVAVDSGDYFKEDSTGIVTKTLRWPEGNQNIKVTYSAGYATIPNDLEQACIEIVSIIYKRRKNGELKSETIGGYSVSYSAVQSSPFVKNIIDLYIKHT